MRHMGPTTWRFWVWWGYVAGLTGIGVTAIAAEPIATYVLDLSVAPWRNVLIASMIGSVGALWGFMRRVAYDETPMTKPRAAFYFVFDILAGIIVSVIVLLLAADWGWTVNRTVIAILATSVGASQAIEMVRKRGWGSGQPTL